MTEELKPHQIAQLVNKLRDIATKYHAHDCLRELISREVNAALTQRPAEQVEAPDKFCFTEADGSCSSKDPRCMHQPAAQTEREADGLPLIVAGAIFDFAGFMTTRSEVIEVGSTAEAGPVADLVKEWAELRGLDLADAAVLSWQLHIARASLPTPKQATPEPVGEPYGWHYSTSQGASVLHLQPSCRLEADMDAAARWPAHHKCTPLFTRPAPGVPEVHTGDELPPAGKFVIAWIEGMKVPLRAMWVPDFHLAANEDADHDWAKYSEEQDAYFAPAGWYECNHHDETNWQIHERVLAWSHLPDIDRAALAAAQAKGVV